MTIRDDIIEALKARREGLSDAQLAKWLDKLHQQINQRCRALADQGLIVRDASSGTIINRWVADRVETSVPQQIEEPMMASASPDGWPQEAAVQSALVGWLARHGSDILRVADTATRERGTDIVASSDGVKLLIEVKGYPGTTYARGPMAGQPKPTAPSLQARHWLADALLKAMRLRGGDEEARVVIAMPDVPRYRSLLSEIDGSLERARIEAWLVESSGEPAARFGGR